MNCALVLAMAAALALPAALEAKRASTPHRLMNANDSNILRLPAAKPGVATILCFHGYGGDRDIARVLRSYPQIEEHLVSFDFPDARCWEGMYDPKTGTFGTPAELERPLRLLHALVVDEGLERVYLYGFSAGGGALINTLVALHSPKWADYVLSLGIDDDAKARMLAAVQRGIVLLDCPLKSIQEILDERGASYEMEVLQARFAQNRMTPIDSVQELAGLGLNVIVHFQDPDEVLTNKLDQEFIRRIESANRNGWTKVVIASEGGHVSYHAALWQAYSEWKRTHAK